jgi:hypothetical protein
MDFLQGSAKDLLRGEGEGGEAARKRFRYRKITEDRIGRSQ